MKKFDIVEYRKNQELPLLLVDEYGNEINIAKAEIAPDDCSGEVLVIQTDHFDGSDYDSTFIAALNNGKFEAHNFYGTPRGEVFFAPVKRQLWGVTFKSVNRKSGSITRQVNDWYVSEDKRALMSDIESGIIETDTKERFDLCEPSDFRVVLIEEWED